MSILSQFWLVLLESMYLPIYEFFGFNMQISVIFLILFVALQVWVFYHFLIKPIMLIAKIFVDFIFKNTLFKGVEYGENQNKK